MKTSNRMIAAAAGFTPPPFVMRSTPTEAASASGTTLLTVPAPTGVQLGDRIFIYAHKPTATAALTAPASPSFPLVVANSAGSDRAHLYSRVADAADVTTSATAGSFNGPARDVSTALVLICFVYPACTIEQARDLAVTNTATIVGVDITVNPSATATILGCGGVADATSIPYTATSTPTGVLDAEHSTTGVSAYVMHAGSVATAPGASVWQGANRAITGSVAKGAVVCYLVPT